jgi:hypothetical protein
MLTGSRSGRNSRRQRLARENNPAEPGKRDAQCGICDIGEGALERRRLVRRQRAGRRIGGKRRRWRQSLHENKTGHDDTAEKRIDPLDQERRAVLQFERGAGHNKQLQGAVAGKSRRLGQEGPIGAGDRRPNELEPAETAAAAFRDDGRRQLRNGDANGAEPRGARLACRRGRR